MSERNRVIEGMQDWKQKEQMIAELFSISASHSKYVQKLKLDHLYELRRNLGKSLTKDERIVMRILRGEIAQMELKLFPNFLVRHIVKLLKEADVLLKHSFKKVEKEIPAWKLKIAHDAIPKEMQQVKLQQKTAIRPVLVLKKKPSQRKSLRIR